MLRQYDIIAKLDADAPLVHLRITRHLQQATRVGRDAIEVLVGARDWTIKQRGCTRQGTRAEQPNPEPDARRCTPSQFVNKKTSQLLHETSQLLLERLRFSFKSKGRPPHRIS